nr:MAG TPA: hypothetical protein [Caudoviricetes sp.]
MLSTGQMICTTPFCRRTTPARCAVSNRETL